MSISDFEMVPFGEVDGIRTYKDSEILELYRRVMAESGAQMFRDRSIADGPAFLRMAKAQGTAFHVAYVRGQVAGCVWLTHFHDRLAQVHFFIFREFWGQDASGLGQHCLRELIHKRCNDGEYWLDMLLGLTPADNRLAVRFAKKCGWKQLCELPYGTFNADTGKSSPAILSAVTREDV